MHGHRIMPNDKSSPVVSWPKTVFLLPFCTHIPQQLTPISQPCSNFGFSRRPFKTEIAAAAVMVESLHTVVVNLLMYLQRHKTPGPLPLKTHCYRLPRTAEPPTPKNQDPHRLTCSTLSLHNSRRKTFVLPPNFSSIPHPRASHTFSTSTTPLHRKGAVTSPFSNTTRHSTRCG